MNYLLLYGGPVSFEVKSKLLRNLKTNIESVTPSPVLQKRIRYIFDELMSNVHEYYTQQGFSGEITSIDSHLKTDKLLEFILISTIGEADKAAFKKHIDHINSLDEAGLKAFYKEKMNKTDSEKGRAGGIGLLTIRMKSGNPIQYEFKKNKTSDIVVLKTVLNLKDE